MVESFLIAAILAKLRGYKVKLVLKSWTIYPALLFAIAYIVLEAMMFTGHYDIVGKIKFFKETYLFVFLFLIIRYRLYIQGIIGSAFLVGGTVLNNIAMQANGGMMPIFPTISTWTGYVKAGTIEKLNDGIHVLGDASVKLKFLTDVFDVGYSVWSIGDILIRVFIGIIIFYSIKQATKEHIAQQL